jgi:hypothetical protein
LDGYLAEYFFIDGQALDPTSFGEFSATTGVWNPKAYTGSYGTNGFRLNFADNSAATATTLGKDAAGSNNWTPNNLSVTAGAGNDSLVDVPTNGSEVDTGAGGQVRGNYCTWNPLVAFVSANRVLANGNLDSSSSSGGSSAYGTFAIPSSGKWYFEVTANNASYIGIDNRLESGSGGPYVHYNPTGVYQTASGTTSYGASFTTGDVIGVAVDVDGAQVTFYKNGSSQGAISFATAGITGKTVWPLNYTESSSVASANFGQRAFAYPVSGFKALNTANLPAPLVTKPSDLFDVKLYAGNGSTQTISGLGFSPDLVWSKSRNILDSNSLFDSVRGVTNCLQSNTTLAEQVFAQSLTAFTADGFTAGSNTGINGSGYTYAAWCWDAGSSTVTNTQGSISSQVRANPSAGFSVVTYTGNNTTSASIGHGLGVAPSMIILKNRSSVVGWPLYHAALGTGKYMEFNLANAVYTAANGFTAVSSTTFTVGADSWTTPNNTSNYVAYCFAPVAGYSSFGSYTGNGLTGTSGPFVYCGFRPKYVLIKKSNGNDNWKIFDSVRDSYNVTEKTLQADLANAELVEAFNKIDILSNGFAIRVTSATFGLNTNNTFVYAAFAEHPFQYARAR